MTGERAVGRKRVWDRMRLRQRVGLRVMNETLPGWWEHVDLDLLDMGDQHLCLLGQMPMGHNVNLRLLAGTDNWSAMHRFAWAHGLDVRYEDAVEHPEVDPYRLLTDMWRRDGRAGAS